MRVRVQWDRERETFSVQACAGGVAPYDVHSVVLLNCKLLFRVIEGDICKTTTRYQTEEITPIGFVNEAGEVRREAECVFLTSYGGNPSVYASVPEEA
jgi:hypothetical protein